MASAQTPEARELALVGKVEMRFALADTDKKLEDLLKLYLAPLLLKLASESVEVRNKVISVCQHVNTRIKPPQDIKLPVAALLKQFKENASLPLIRHFDILYIQQGISRLPVSERLELLPILIHGIADDYSASVQHTSQLFHMILRLLAHFKLPLRGTKEDDELRVTLGVNENDAQFLAKWFGKLLLLTVVRRASLDTAPAVRVPGLSVEDYKFLTLQGKPDAWDPASESGLNLAESKSLVVRLLASGLFSDDEKFLPSLFASADANSRISEVGEDMFKRVLLVKNIEKNDIVESLLDLYFGSAAPDGALPVRTPLRIKILGVLSRIAVCTSYPEHIARIVEEGLLAPELNSTDRTTTGREASKFRSAIFLLVNSVARRGSAENISKVAESLVGNLRAFIQDQGWPAPDREQDMELRGYGYETIGLLAKAAPNVTLLEPTLDLLEWLFKSLREDSSTKDVAVSIEEALSSVLGAFSQSLDSSVQQSLRQILLKYSLPIQLNGQEGFFRSTRYVATRFANRCLPYHDVLARWIDILAVSVSNNERHEVIEEGRKGLDPHWFRMSNSVPGSATGHDPISFPDLNDLVQFIFSQEFEADMMDIDDDGNVTQVVNRFMQQFPTTVPTAIAFCSEIAIHAAMADKGIQEEVSEDWSRKITSLITTNVRARQAFRAYARNSKHAQALATILRASFDLLTRDGVGEIGDVGDTLIVLLSLCPMDTWAVAELPDQVRALVSSILSNNPNRRLAAAHAYGLLTSHPMCNEKLLDETQSLFFNKLRTWKTAVGAEINQISGVIIALGYYFSRRHWRHEQLDPSSVDELCQILIDALQNTRDSTLKMAVFSCIGQLCMFSVIKPEMIHKHAKFQDVAQQIHASAKTGATNAVLAFGQLTMIVDEVDSSDSEEETSDYDYVATKLNELHEVRQPEVQFSVGEALSVFAIGWESQALTTELDIEHPEQSHDPWDIPLQTPSGAKRSKTLSTGLEKTLQGCMQTKPSLKKASVIWLLCLLQYCGHIPELQTHLPSCQQAFKNCLTDRDEVVQEAASRGLGLVYEKGDRQLKNDLVRDLVGSFSDNKNKMSGTVSEDTQLFEPGVLPTGEGNASITTYKDILSLASEVGDSSLVYRFMSLASNNSIWSSRAAFGRFGLSNIFSDSSVDGYLAENPKLYPKLYRYRFDPNPNVQRSMNDIWNSLVKDSSSTINNHFDSIMEDLLTSILTKEWRVRQASCAAISELVQGRSVEKYEKYLGEVWDKCFKVLDDIKESVRTAAGSLARVLTGILTRSLEAGDASLKNASAMLSRVLPFLLSTSGLESSAEEVRAFSVRTLLDIIKKSNAKSLNPHSPELVERLLGLLSSLEPEAVNYIHLNASKYNLTEQKIDDMRLQSVRSSPLTESIERCFDLADADTMKALVPRIEAAMKNAVGLPSKVGCSRVLVTLSTRHNFVFKPHADRFLKLIQKYVHDRNDTVATSYAAAAGYVARLASDKQLLATISFCQELYFDPESESDRSRLTSGDMILSISKNASDRFTAFAAELLPFVFLAKHDSHEQVRQLFSDIWGDNVAGPRAVLLYLQEIIGLCDKNLEARKWVFKHTAARAMGDVVMTITAGNSEKISSSNAELIRPVLEKAKKGKSWEGKEKVVEAWARFEERT